MLEAQMLASEEVAAKQSPQGTVGAPYGGGQWDVSLRGRLAVVARTEQVVSLML